jgi:hypothetical protein
MTAQQSTTRAELLPEEKVAGSDDPKAQAELILEESEDRALHPEKAEARSSDEATPPV